MSHRNNHAPRLAPLAIALSLCFVASTHAATIAVSTGNLTHGSGNCTLLDAVNSINQGSLVSGTGCAVTGSFGSNDTVLLANNVFTFSNDAASGGISSSAASAMVLTKPMILIGTLDSNTGQPLATIQRADSASHFRLIETSANLTLNGVTIKNGISDVSGDAGGTGAGILSVSKNQQISLTLINSVVTGNNAVGNAFYSSYGGGIYAKGSNVTLTNSNIGTTDSYYSTGNTAYHGGGIDVIAGTLTVSASTISGNQATNGYGGGILSDGLATLTNSTVYGNYASTGGGGIAANTVALNFCTIAKNTTLNGQAGGGVLIGANSTSTASLLVGNDPGNDVDGRTNKLTLSGDYNSAHTLGSNVTIAGGVHNKSCSALPNNPASNGGPTMTMALTAPTNACAIDAGPVSTGSLASDQRGAKFERRAGVATDIGAFELQPAGDRIFYDGFEP